jgi:hypothetical protein
MPCIAEFRPLAVEDVITVENILTFADNAAEALEC